MAGLFAVFAKDPRNPLVISDPIRKRIIDSLRYSPEQKFWQHSAEGAYVCSVAKIGEDPMDYIFWDKDQKAFYVLDGHLSLCGDSSERDRSSSNGRYENIPKLFDKYGIDYVKCLKGSFNLLSYDQNHHQASIVNDRFGFYPLYFFESDQHLVVSSKISGILSSGLLSEARIDHASILEHLVFNYVVTDNTYIQGIRTIPGASQLIFSPDKTEIRRYWEIREAFDSKSLSKGDSFELIHSELSKACKGILSQTSDMLNLSFTGGWDSRLVLSYFNPTNSHRLKLYSFGAPNSPDIEIPRRITEKEGLDYTPLVLDSQYLDKDFLKYAKQTILLSGGTRNYKRAHYLYGVMSVSKHSRHLITGIFGDEVMKVGKPSGGEVISRAIIDLIDVGFKIAPSMFEREAHIVASLFSGNTEQIIDEMIARVQSIGDMLSIYNTKAEKYCAFRFTVNLRKYFGFEASSYNDFVFCHSPFIDMDFFNAYMSTSFAGFRYEFKPQSYLVKKQTTDLYAKLTMRNCPRLAEYESDRGYSMKDSQSAYRSLKILKDRLMKPKRGFDAFNTRSTDVLFREFIQNEYASDLRDSFNGYNQIDEKTLSLIYWSQVMRQKVSV